MIDAVIVRYGELALKNKGTRRWYEKILMQNIKGMLNSLNISYSDVSREWGRIFVHTTDPKAAKATSNVFGVVSTSPVRTTDATLENIAQYAEDYAENVLEGETYAVRARRSGSHVFSSQDIALKSGDAIWEKLEKMCRKPAVDLTDPDKEFFIEVRDNRAYIFTEKIKGVAGLPLGTQGKMVALVSGGIDSPVSAWMMMRRGVEIIPVYFDNDPYADSSTLNRAIECINVLQSWAPNYPMKTYSVPHGESLGSFIQHCGKKNTCVLCKRTMYRVSYEIMKKENAQGIITGSSLGQVASQTAANMHAEIYGLGIPLYHPLIGLDKNDIIDLARKIGTYRPSTSKATCCSAVPVHPEVNAKYDSLVYEEEMAGIEELVEKAVKNTKIISLS